MVDAELIKRLQSGENAALEALYERHAAQLLGIALQIVGQRAIAETILGETFFYVWEHADAFPAHHTTVFNWLLNLICDRALEYLRQQGLAHRPQARVQWALAQLPEDQRQVIELSMLTKLDRHEIALRLGRSESTIALLAQQGLKTLQHLLETTRKQTVEIHHETDG